MAIIGIFIFSVPHLIAITMKVMQGNADEARLNDTNYILQLFEPNLNLIFMLLPFVGGLLCLLLIVKVLHSQSAVQLTTARDRIDWSRVWFAFVLWGVVSVAIRMLCAGQSNSDSAGRREARGPVRRSPGQGGSSDEASARHL